MGLDDLNELNLNLSVEKHAKLSQDLLVTRVCFYLFDAQYNPSTYRWTMRADSSLYTPSFNNFLRSTPFKEAANILITDRPTKDSFQELMDPTEEKRIALFSDSVLEAFVHHDVVRLQYDFMAVDDSLVAGMSAGGTFNVPAGVGPIWGVQRGSASSLTQYDYQPNYNVTTHYPWRTVMQKTWGTNDAATSQYYKGSYFTVATPRINRDAWILGFSRVLETLNDRTLASTKDMHLVIPCDVFTVDVKVTGLRSQERYSQNSDDRSALGVVLPFNWAVSPQGSEIRVTGIIPIVGVCQAWSLTDSTMKYITYESMQATDVIDNYPTLGQDEVLATMMRARKQELAVSDYDYLLELRNISLAFNALLP